MKNRLTVRFLDVVLRDENDGNAIKGKQDTIICRLLRSLKIVLWSGSANKKFYCMNVSIA